MKKNEDDNCNKIVGEMNLLLKELEVGGPSLASNIRKMNEVFYYWSECVSSLFSDRKIESEADKKHYIPKMHLANFGLATSRKNHSLRALRFYDSSFIGKALFIEEGLRYTKTDKMLLSKSAFSPHMEEAFAKIETMISRYFREYIKIEISSNPKPIEQVKIEQLGFTDLFDRVDFKLLLSTYIIICNYKFAYPGKEYHDILYRLFQDTLKLREMISSIFYRRWIFAYASGGAELSLASRAVIHLPEREDGFFLSISRFWGLWVVSTSDTKNILDKILFAREGYNPASPQNVYIHDMKKPVVGIGEILGRKLNKIMYDNFSGREIELFYPFAERLEFHPDVDLKNFRFAPKAL